MEQMSLAQARRTVLAAQGFATLRPPQVTMRHVQREITRLGQLQIDSVNVVVRAHYAPLFARLGPYDTTLLDRAAGQAPRRVFEYWGHAASLIDAELHPALRFRMARHAAEPGRWYSRVEAQHPGLLARVRAEVAASPRPLTARDIEHEEVRRRDRWGWNWSAVKTSLEWLWTTGEILPAHRNSQFERAFAPWDRVVPARIAAAPALEADEAHRVLLERAARALGVGTLTCLADYFRLGVAPTKAAIAALVDAGTLVPVEVAGWGRAWRHAKARTPRRVDARALVCPFDPLVFERSRVLGLFGVHYRIGIYTPAAQREHGYYVYLFVQGEELTARVDLKADRRAGVLRVQSAFRTEATGRPDDEIAVALASELVEMARWLGLAEVQASDKGDLAAALVRALARGE